MSDARKPTYDQLSALCAQMAAALEPFQKACESAAWPTFEPDNCPVDDSMGVYVKHLRSARTALTAYRTLSPDPVYAEAKNMLALLDGFHTCPECDRMTGPAWTHLRDKHMGDCDVGNTINRARGEG